MLATATHFWYTVSRMKQGVQRTEGAGQLSEHIWETFEGLFKTVHRQSRRMEELEARICELERMLADRNPKQAKSLAHTGDLQAADRAA